MNNYVNYRYQSYLNQSFQNEFRAGNGNIADFTGARLKSCNFRCSSLIGADFSETAIGMDAKLFQAQVIQMVSHILWGIPLGLVGWFSSQVVLGCGIAGADPYGWMTNPFGWIFVFSTAATMSKKWFFPLYVLIIGLMIAVALLFNPIFVLVGLVAFGVSFFGMYLGYKEGSIAVGMVWIAVGVSSAISAGYSWINYKEFHYAILFAALTILPAILATRAFNLHFAKVKLTAMTSFYGADLTNARFVNAVLENCDFLGANLEGVDWQGATFKHCKFPKGFSRDGQKAIAENTETNLSIKQVAINN